MKRRLALMIALAGGLVLAAAAGASAAPNIDIDLKSSIGTGSGLVELVGRGGGG